MIFLILNATCTYTHMNNELTETSYNYEKKSISMIAL